MFRVSRAKVRQCPTGAESRSGSKKWNIVTFLVLTVIFVILTQYPLPDPTALVCPVDATAPQLSPFGFLDTVRRLEHREAAVVEFLTNRMLATTALNFLVCFAIGISAVNHMTWRQAALLGVALTFAVELTQLTGIWGFYPCAYRQFDVDDLLMNATGVSSGAYLRHRMACRAT